MRIAGFSKTTLLDYPGHLAATVFLGGCNFSCPFCHNGDLISLQTAPSHFSEEEILAALAQRKHLIEGVCITGAEATLSKELPSFLSKIKELGLLVKLDTNGSKPAVLEALLNEGLLDYVAMDIKAAPFHYPTLCGLKNPDMASIFRSVEILFCANLPYEFRTTYVKPLHTKDDALAIRDWICGADAYYLQNFQDANGVRQKGLSPFSKEEMLDFLSIVQEKIPSAALRGID